VVTDVLGPLPSITYDLSPKFGGAERNRTADLRLAKPPLSQLSYSPIGGCQVAGVRCQVEWFPTLVPETHHPSPVT
jgi:hypothetical protein